jgi:hypothetical protein
MERVSLIGYGRSRTCEVVNLIELPFDAQGSGDIGLFKGKSTRIQQMFNIGSKAGLEGVNADDFAALCQKPFAEVRADKASAASDQDGTSVTRRFRFSFRHQSYFASG